MTLALRDLDAIGRSLTSYLRETWGRPVVVEELVETSVGARRGNILFRTRDADRPAGETAQDLVVTIYPPAGTTIFGVEAETAALALAEAAGAPVAHVFAACTDPSWFGEPFFISQRIFGETLPRNVLRLTDTTDGLGDRVGRQLGAAFAAIHRVPAADCPEVVRRDPSQTPSAHMIATLAALLEELREPLPSFELALRWLARNQPDPPARRTMVHGDVRTGNIVVSPAGLEAVLDWEGCHTGDPHEDLSWPCVRTWRFGNDTKEVGGYCDRATLTDAYEEAGGRFDPAAFQWWKTLNTLRWGIGLSRQAFQHLNGTHRGIAMAASGRRAAELEFDLLRLLAGVF